jgi:hypothetical protein
MNVVSLIVLGLIFSIPLPNTPCADVIHQLRTGHRMEVTAA